MASKDPTELKNILVALESSDRLTHYHKPPKEFGPDNPEFSEYNRNGLTDPGDLSMISFTEEFAFGESSSDESGPSSPQEKQENEQPDDLIYEDSFSDISSTQEWADPAEVIRAKDKIPSLRIAEQARHQKLLIVRMDEMRLEDECKKISQQKAVTHYMKYMMELKEIKRTHRSQVQKYIKERDEAVTMEEMKLRKREEEISQLVKQKDQEYAQYIVQKSSELTKLIEDTERREEEHRNLIQGYVNELQTMKASFTDTHDLMKQLLRDLNSDQTLDMSVETMRDEALRPVNSILESVVKEVVSQNELVEVKISLQANLTYVESVIHALNSKKLEKAQQEAEQANQQARLASAAESQARLRAEQQKAEQAQRNEVIEVQATQATQAAPSSEEGRQAQLINVNKKRFEDLKKKMEGCLAIQNEMDNDKKKEIGRIATIINQLDTTNHNVNREKLQKLLAYLGGRNVTHNNKKYCTNNDPKITAYAKFRLVKDIVKVALDTQTKDGAGIAAYSWLMMSLIGVHHDMWEVFLYHIYMMCPYLVPLLIYHKDGQSMEDFDKERGKRPKEQLDVYLSRMGNAALMFGLVLSKMCKKTSGMPEEAPVVGWKLLAGLLTLDPSPGVSASVLRQLLIGVGADLQQTYGKQFAKLMDFAMGTYFQRAAEVTDATEQGKSLQNQLQTLLEEYRRTRKLKPHEHIDKYN